MDNEVPVPLMNVHYPSKWKKIRELMQVALDDVTNAFTGEMFYSDRFLIYLQMAFEFPECLVVPRPALCFQVPKQRHDWIGTK